MLVLKYICFVIAVIATCLFISNLAVDITSMFSWRKTEEDDTKENGNKISDEYAIARFIMSLIMGLTWGVVAIL